MDLDHRYQEEIFELKSQLDEEVNNRENEISARLEAYADEQRYKLQDLDLKNERLKQEHQIALEILREENDSIRDQLEEKQSIIQDLEEFRFLNEKLKCDFSDKERLYEEKITSAEDEIALLKEENRKILETFKSDTKDNKLHVSIQIANYFSLNKIVNTLDYADLFYAWIVLFLLFLLVTVFFLFTHPFSFPFLHDECRMAQTVMLLCRRLPWDDVRNCRMKSNRCGLFWI